MPKSPEEIQAEEDARLLEEKLKAGEGEGEDDDYEELYTPPHLQLGYKTEEDMVATLETENKILKEQLALRDTAIEEGNKRKGFEIPVTAEEFTDDPQAATKKIVDAALSQSSPSTREADLKIELDQAVNKEVRAAGLKGYDEDIIFGKMYGISQDPKNAHLKESKTGIAEIGEMAIKEVDKMLKRKTPAPPEHGRSAGGPSGDPARRLGEKDKDGEVDYDAAFKDASAKGDLKELNRLAFEKHHKQVGKALDDAKKQ